MSISSAKAERVHPAVPHTKGVSCVLATVFLRARGRPARRHRTDGGGTRNAYGCRLSGASFGASYGDCRGSVGIKLASTTISC
jgi:hypothetical protein